MAHDCHFYDSNDIDEAVEQGNTAQQSLTRVTPKLAFKFLEKVGAWVIISSSLIHIAHGYYGFRRNFFCAEKNK